MSAAEARRFWGRYDLPFEHDTAIKARLSGLSRGSDGTGHAADTVVHLHVKESFTDGRLSREAGSLLCEKGSAVGPNGSEERHTEDGTTYVPAVSCSTCLDRMARWRVDEAATEDEDA